VRRPEFTAENLRGIDVGAGQTLHLTYGPRPGAKPPATPAPKQDEPPATTAVTAPGPAAAAAPPATPPAAPPAIAPPATAPGPLPPATAPPEGAPTGAPPVAPQPPRPDQPSQSTGTASVRFLPPTVNTSAGSSMTVALIIQNDTGTATINLNRLPGSAGVSGSGVLVTVILQAVAPGTTPLRVPNLNVKDAKGNTVAGGMPQMVITVK